MRSRLLKTLTGILATAIIVTGCSLPFGNKKTEEVPQNEEVVFETDNTVADNDYASTEDFSYGDELVTTEAPEDEMAKEDATEDETEENVSNGQWIDENLENAAEETSETEEVEESVEEPSTEEKDVAENAPTEEVATEKKHDPVVAHSKYQGTTNVRTGPGTEYDIITTVQTNETVTCTERHGAWYKVTLTDGTEGYMIGDYLYVGEGTVKHGETLVAPTEETPANTADQTSSTSESEPDNTANESSSGSTQNVQPSNNQTQADNSSNTQPSNETASSENTSVQASAPVQETKKTETSGLNPDTDDIFSIVDSNSRKAESAFMQELHNYAYRLAFEGAVTVGDGTSYGNSMDLANTTECYYQQMYSMRGQGTYDRGSSTYNSDGTWTLNKPVETTLPEIMRYTVKSIGLTNKGNKSNLEYATSIANQVTRYFSYDMGMLDATMTDAVSTKKGVCYHYARATYILLNYQGIPARIVTGELDGDAHAWVEAIIDGKTYTIEATVSGWNPTAIVYSGVPSNYREYSMFVK